MNRRTRAFPRRPLPSPPERTTEDAKMDRWGVRMLHQSHLQSPRERREWRIPLRLDLGLPIQSAQGLLQQGDLLGLQLIRHRVALEHG